MEQHEIVRAIEHLMREISSDIDTVKFRMESIYRKVDFLTKVFRRMK